MLTRDDCVSLKPRNVESAYAVAFCYTLATVWSAMKMARVPIRNASDFRVLIHGGSGGIGATAIQLLQNWNAQKIVATCSEKKLFLKNFFLNRQLLVSRSFKISEQSLLTTILQQ